jgi:hypothetical protein
MRSTVLLVVAVVASACGSSGPTGPSQAAPGRPLSASSESAHYVFHHVAGDTVDAARQEAFHEWVVPELGVTLDRPIDFFKYLDRAHMLRLTGRETNGWAEPSANAVHSIFGWNAHEAVHVLTAPLGRPSDFWNEGIAVALSFDPLGGRFHSLWSNVPVHTIARQAKAGGTIVRPTQVIETAAFRALPDAVSYPHSGSFVGFLIDRYGQARLNGFFRHAAGREESAAVMRDRVQATWGLTIEQLEAAWIAWLD